MAVQTADARDFQGQVINIRYESIPDECPLCHHHVVPTTIVFRITGQNVGASVHGLFQCPRAGCQGCFIGIYRRVPNIRSGSHATHMLVRVTPVTPEPVGLPGTVAKISPTFVTIYQQAFAAEGFDLDQLVGGGLRKALEFLVKDYAIGKDPDHREQIAKATLSSCIADYIEDPNAKDCAKRAAWLGNDETHYFRRWEDKDITHLKLLIKMTVNWIDNILMTAQFKEDMPDAGPAPAAGS